MRVEAACVNLGSVYERRESLTVRESLRTGPAVPAGTTERVDLSDAGRAAGAARGIAEAREAALRDPRLRLLAALLERLTGRRILLEPEGDEARPEADPPAETRQPRPEAIALFLRYDFEAEHRLREAVSFAAEALVKTADGREIRVKVNFALEREAVERLGLSIRVGQEPRPKDPLVLNFGGPSAQLTETRFLFDLDADGREEAIPFVAAGSAFLAIDRNGDGRINDGRELFGPASGDGFHELAAYDADGNGFIDEADPAYQRLLLFNRGPEGDRLVPLSTAGVGAIHLGRAATPFELAAGFLRTSSFYLTESGGAGTVQQVDLRI